MSHGSRQARDMFFVVIGFMALIVAGTVGFALAEEPDPTSASAEAGFARDMRDHHAQAVTMANVVRDRSTDPAIRYLALDIATGQQAQIGMMSGWLDQWGLNQTDDRQPRMAWMSAEGGHAATAGSRTNTAATRLGADGRMPGMATKGDIDRLRTLSGRDAEVLWLTLMAAHHRGGVAMAKVAVDLVRNPYERNLAEGIVDSQTAEINYFNELLANRGAPAA